MERTLIRMAVLLLALTALGLSAQAAVVFEMLGGRAVLNDNATWQSVMDMATGRECVAKAGEVAIASVTHSGRTFQANSAVLAGDALTLRFADTNTMLVYQVERAEDWVVLRLNTVAGTRPERLVLLRVPVRITTRVGRRLNIAWDDKTAVCVMAVNRQVDCGAARRDFADLVASTQDAPGPRIEGAAAALIICPPGEFKAVARKASHTFGLLTNEDAGGRPVKDTELPKGSYWFLSFGEADVDKVVEYCERAGIKQVMMSSGSWCKTVGHYTFQETRYPDGIESLKRVVDRLHACGILVGMHTFVSKVSKTDPYVTPVPDKRFWKDRQTALAADVTADQTEIRVDGDLSQWPGSPVCKQKTWEGGVEKHQEVIVDDEIIWYRSIGPEGRWDTFLGCKRGAWGTAAATHKAGAAGSHFGVDGCINGYIIDQETSLMDEVSDRIAHIFNYCGFDMVYFDGGEDVDRRRFNYYVSNFQEQAMRRFTKRPIIHMGTIMTHLLWHSFARSSTVDTYLNTLYGAIQSGASVDKWPTVREHIDRSVRYLESINEDMVPGELGWFGIWPKGEHTDGLQLDEVEYLMVKSLAYDAPISLQTDFSQMSAHVLTPGILDIVRYYEYLRGRGSVPADLQTELRQPGKDFVALNLGGDEGFYEVEEVPLVGGTHDVRAFVGACEVGSFATLWHYLRDGEIVLTLDPAKVYLSDIVGQPIEFRKEKGRAIIPVGSRRNTLICEGMTPASLKAALAGAEVRVSQPVLVFVQAEDCSKLEGEMARGSQVGVREPEAFGDVVVCTALPSPAEAKPWYAEYTVNLPHAGRWTVWARVRYPTGADLSFGLVPEGQAVTLAGSQVLGNCGVNEKKWHWTGSGTGTTAVPPGQPITLELDKGLFTFHVYAREGTGHTATNPRLDVICFADEAFEPPTDEQAARALGK